MISGTLCRPWSAHRFYALGGLTGIVPALKVTGSDLHDVLKDESRGSSGFRMGRITKRTLHAAKRRFSMDFAMTTFFTQLGLRKTYRQMHDEIRARYSN